MKRADTRLWSLFSGSVFLLLLLLLLLRCDFLTAATLRFFYCCYCCCYCDFFTAATTTAAIFFTAATTTAAIFLLLRFCKLAPPRNLNSKIFRFGAPRRKVQLLCATLRQKFIFWAPPRLTVERTTVRAVPSGEKKKLSSRLQTPEKNKKSQSATPNAGVSPEIWRKKSLGASRRRFW